MFSFQYRLKVKWILAFMLCVSLPWQVSAKITEPETKSFVAVSDIHFNPFANCARTPCELIITLQKAPASQWSQILENHRNPIFNPRGTDTNIAMLDSSLTALHRLPHTYQFVLVTGDFIAHQYRTLFDRYTGLQRNKAGESLAYADFVKKTFQYLSLRLQATFPHTPLYIAIGNVDSFIDDYQMNPENLWALKAYQAFSDIFVKTLYDKSSKIDFLSTFPKSGYYALTLPGESQHRLIFLNSVLFSYKLKQTTDIDVAKQELVWLQGELEKARSMHQQVWIIDHIPDGIDMFATLQQGGKPWLFWNAAAHYHQQFKTLLDTYSDVIKVVISAHVHLDTYQLLSTSTNTILNTFIPSISRYNGNYPMFKIYQYKTKTFELSNFQTYFIKSDVPHAKWTLEYDFDKTYASQNLLEGYQHIQQTGPFALSYEKYYDGQAYSQRLSRGQDVRWYWCGVHYQNESGFNTCTTGAAFIKW